MVTLSVPAAMPAFPQVLSPFSDAILGERVLTVDADRTALRSLLPRPVASLQLQLSPEPMGEQDGKGETKKANGGAASLVGGAWKIFNLSVQMNTSLSRPGQVQTASFIVPSCCTTH